MQHPGFSPYGPSKAAVESLTIRWLGGAERNLTWTEYGLIIWSGIPHLLGSLLEPKHHRPRCCPEVVDLHFRGTLETGKEPVEHRLPDLGITIDAGPHPDLGVGVSDGSISTSRSPEPTTPT